MQDGTVTRAPAAPAIRVDAGPTSRAQTIAIPQTVQDLEGLRARRSDLADQLERAMNRRAGVIEQMEESAGIQRAGLEQRMTALDERILQIEADIAATERSLTNAPTALLGEAKQVERAADAAREANRPPVDEDLQVVLAVFAMFLTVPIVMAHVRRIWKRPAVPRALPVAAEGRLERIEQAVEAIAVEVERVSEGQRFVTKLMSEAKAVPLSDPARLMRESKK